MLKFRVPVDENLSSQLCVAWLSLRDVNPIELRWYETNPLYVHFLLGNRLRGFLLGFSSERFYRRFGNRYNYRTRRPGSEPPLPLSW